MKRVLWLAIVSLFILPQYAVFGSSTFTSAIYILPENNQIFSNLRPYLSVPVDFLASRKSPDAYPIHSGFPIIVDRWIENAPVVIADINGDGSNEMLLQSYNEGQQNPGKIYGWDNNGQMLPGFPIATDGWLRNLLTLTDLNNDGDLEIVGEVRSFYTGIGAKVYIWQSDGSVFPGWPQQTACFRADYYCGVHSIVISDIDGDTDLEVIAGTDNRNLDYQPGEYIPNLYVWHSDGQPAAGNWPVEDPRDCGIFGSFSSR